VSGLWPALGRAITGIPRPIASAMLAGILFPICLAPVTASVEQPLLATPVVLVWLVLYRLAPRWAVPAAMVVAGVGVALTAGTGWITAASSAPGLVFVPPEFDPIVIVSLGLPLFIVTMAGQNVPGFVVMSTFGFRPPPRAVLVGSGLATMAGATFGAHNINLAAITAALMASPDAHPDASKRWIATAASGVTYLGARARRRVRHRARRGVPADPDHRGRRTRAPRRPGHERDGRPGRQAPPHRRDRDVPGHGLGCVAGRHRFGLLGPPRRRTRHALAGPRPQNLPRNRSRAR